MISTVRLTMQESLMRAYTRDGVTRDGLLTPPTKAELEENQRRTAAMSGVDLGRLWIGDVLSKTKAGAIKDRRVLDEALAALATGLRGYFGGQLGRSEAEAGPANSLAFTAEKPDLTTPEGARAEVNANREIGERWNAENRRLAGQEELQTDARDEDPEKPWNGSGAPQELGQTIGDRRPRKTADGVLGDVPQNRSIGDTINARNRRINGQPELLHGQ